MALTQQIVESILKSDSEEDINKLKNELDKIFFSTKAGKILQEYIDWKSSVEIYIEHQKSGIKVPGVDSDIERIVYIIKSLENLDKQ